MGFESLKKVQYDCFKNHYCLATIQQFPPV